ncbi:MAG TPA: 3-hydroxyacyl-CoA dehydrogenase NAD-binding domain-containing protein [Bacteroidia bacterium]|nr:3-hydroxyacyl-CoA dehydrogenase NAD-binding domain-containing protein [Bacteroidia bacterium]
MENSKIIGVAGAGAMGNGIAQVAATAGHRVIIMDSNAAVIEKAKNSVSKDFEKLIGKGKLSRERAEEILSLMHYTGNENEFSDCSLVIEAIIENLEVKKELFKRIENVVNADCILATNTSSLPVVAVASSCIERSRVLGIHFFNPAPLMPLVEIIPAFTTNESIVLKAREIINSWGKITVLAKDTPGFIVNRIARPFYGESLKIFEEGIADFATIDWAMKKFGGFRMGPFELMDFIGNDINYKVSETVWEQMFYDPRYRPSLTQKRLYEAGLFGRKSGRGYYSYQEGNSLPPADENEIKGKYIFDRILAMLINEATEALYMNIASRDDIELAMTKGVNYPKGLLKWADEIGIATVLTTLEKLLSDYNDDRYRPSLLLKKMVAEKRTFY